MKTGRQVSVHDGWLFTSLGVCRFEIFDGKEWVVCENLVIGQIGVYDEVAA